MLSLFCLQLTSLTVYDHDLAFNGKRKQIDESQLIRIATNSPNVRHLRINGPVHDLTPEGADRAAQLWSRVEELDLRGSRFNDRVLTKFVKHFQDLKSLKIDYIHNGKVQLFDTIFLYHPKLVDFECIFGDYLQKTNWFRSCDLPLKRFVVERIWNEEATLDTLEKCCKDSLQTIHLAYAVRDGSQVTSKIFSTFQQLREVSLYINKFSDLQNKPVLPHLEKLCLHQVWGQGFEDLIDFLKPYPELKEFHLKDMRTDIKAVKNITAILPNLQSFSFQFAELNSTVLKSVTSLKKLEHFNFGVGKKLVIEDVQAFVREMPSLQRLTFWLVGNNSIDEYFNFYKAIRDEIRSSGSNRQLWVGQEDDLAQGGGLYFSLDSSETCTDAAIENFVKELKKRKKAWNFC